MNGHRVRRSVYVGDDDASGLIYFATYFRYMAEGDQDHMAALGHPVIEGMGQGATCPAVSSSCDFLSPARAGDDLEQIITINPGRRSSFTCEHLFKVGDRLVARGRIVRVWVDLATLTPLELPRWLRAEAS
ncbi:MAG: acyl-CoA thioesterase [Solirubrobacterales bacterium]